MNENDEQGSEMSGQRTASTGGAAASVAAGCSLRETTRPKTSSIRLHDEGLAVFSWGRGEDGQLGLGDTRYVPAGVCPAQSVYHNVRGFH